MEEFLQIKLDAMSKSTIHKRVPAKQFGKNLRNSMEFDYTKRQSGKRRRSEMESKLSCSYCCSETEIASPKVSISEVYTKHNNFVKRKMQIRSKSGLCDESVDKKIVGHFAPIISVKPMNKEKDTTDKDDSTIVLIKPKDAASDDQANEVQMKSNGGLLTTKKQSLAYDSYDEDQPDVVATTVTPKRLYFSESDESSHELSPSKAKQQSSTRETSSSLDEDDSSVQLVKKLKLDEFHINRPRHVPTQPKNKKKKEIKREDQRRRKG